MFKYVFLTALQLSFCQAAHGSGSNHPRRNHAENVQARAASVVTSIDPSSTASVQTVIVATGTQQILPTLSLSIPATTGTVQTSLETGGRSSVAPFVTSVIPSPATTISVASNSSVMATPTVVISSKALAADIFAVPIATTAPKLASSNSSGLARRSSRLMPKALDTSNPGATIPVMANHPVPRTGIQSGNFPIGTNKFYAALFLAGQTSSVYLHPYSVSWSGGSASSYGMSISHTEANQRVYGNEDSANASSYFINPVGIRSMILSASELGSSTVLTTDKIKDMSINAQLRAVAGGPVMVDFPLMQGMGFITARYTSSTPQIQTGVYFQSVTKVSTAPRAGVQKYRVALNDGTTWLIYSYAYTGSLNLNLTVVNSGMLQNTRTFTGVIQIAKSPSTADEAVLDTACMAYPTAAALSASVSGTQASYTYTYTKGGLQTRPMLMFALPHHVSSFDSATTANMTASFQMQTTTKGIAKAVQADSWTMVESLTTSVGFVPWTPTQGSISSLSSAAKAKVSAAAVSELSQDIMAQTNQNSMYYGGKALAKFAMILVVTNDMVGDSALTAAGLSKLKTAYAQFATNMQQNPLVYDSSWGGIVSSAGYADSGADFGNTYYNDHHFHYGYHVLAGAIIAHLDPTWLSANKDYVDGLVRDYANPSSADKYFPVSRNFDWFHGHSWAHGLYDTSDGKDQESSSEDTMASYALQMWGMVSGDPNMQARGSLMLAVQSRALNDYYLYDSDNTIEPAQFIGNRVAGILFENKIDHTTYFGTNIEYIQGIHMLPLIPSTQLIRKSSFVSLEWNEYFSNGRAAVDSGWRGILYGNLATIDPATAWAFFTQSNFDMSWIDGGASLTWYLAYTAAVGGI